MSDDKDDRALQGPEARMETSEAHSVVIARLAYDRANAAIGMQERRVERIRNRSLGVAGVTITLATFTARDLLDEGQQLSSLLQGGSGLLLILTGAMLFCVGYIVWPHEMQLDEDAHGILHPWYTSADTSEAFRALADHRANAWTDNCRVEDRLWSILRFQLVLSVVVLIGWLSVG